MDLALNNPMKVDMPLNKENPKSMIQENLNVGIKFFVITMTTVKNGLS